MTANPDFWPAIQYGVSQVVAIIDIAVGSAILIAACIVKLSRWYRRLDVLNRIESMESGL